MKAISTKKKKSQILPRAWTNRLVALLVSLILVGFGWLSQELSRSPFSAPTETPTLYSNQSHSDLTQLFLQSIQNAKQSIYLMVYSLSDSVIIKALKEKAAEGVNVRVVVDGTATPFAERKLGSNVHVIRRHGDGLMHLKILVVDEELVILGSANMTRESLQMHGNLVTSLKNKILAQHIIEKSLGIKEEGRSIPMPHTSFDLGSQNLELWFLPDNRDASIKIKQLIHGAKKSIRVAMFTWTRLDFAKAIVDRHRRGVSVEVVIDRYSGKGASAHVVDYLKKEGIPVWLSIGNALFHHKFMYIDGITLVNGSANWTKAAFNQNDDCFMILSPLTDTQKEEMERLWKNIEKEAA